MTGRRPVDEAALLARIRDLVPGGSDDLIIGPGDDCAAIDIGGDRLLLLTCDVQVEGRHFSRSILDPAALGRRLVAVNLSDIAAMGGWPRHALLSLLLPEDATDWGEAIVAGVADALGEHGAYLAGGNLSGIGNGICADLSLIGEVERRHVLRRSGAREGDAILVTGHLGSSAAGLRALSAGAEAGRDCADAIRAHVAPCARLDEGRAIATSGIATSMIDLSDGLSVDLGRICERSGVGADVLVDALPVADSTRRICERLSMSARNLALGGGEDYELLFTAPADHADALARRVERAGATPVTRIGLITSPRSGIRFLDTGGTELDGVPGGWDHFRD